MMEAAMLWNEPNNISHWDFEVDPEWDRFAAMVKLAAKAIQAENPKVTKVLGGISPIDARFMERMRGFCVLSHVDAVAVHGFPLDWNHWTIHEWPAKLAEIRAVTRLPLWVSEVGVSTFGAEEVQQFGLKRSAELLIGKAPRIHWYSLFDLPSAWPAITRHREAEGSAYYRHFYMGLLREDGAPKLAARDFRNYTPDFGICQWFHFEDPRFEFALEWSRRHYDFYLVGYVVMPEHVHLLTPPASRCGAGVDDRPRHQHPGSLPRARRPGAIRQGDGAHRAPSQ